MLSLYMQKLDILYYLCSMKTTQLIQTNLNAIPVGTVFDYSCLDVSGSSLSAVAQAISRMVKSGKLRKVGKGKFYKPKFSRLGEVPPLTEELLRDLLFKDDKRIGYITGVPAFAQLGLTTQISSKIIIGSNTYRRPLSRGGYEISYTKQLNIITESNIPLLKILDAIKYIKSIPAVTPNEVVIRLKEIIRNLSKREITTMTELVMNYPAATRALFGAILESIGITVQSIMASLNPFSKYIVGVSSDILPNKSNWNIE